LRIGPDAVAADDTAATVWELGDAMPTHITIAVPRTWRGSLRGVRVGTRELITDECTVRDDVPVTTIERNHADLAHADPSQAAETIHDARYTGRLSERVWRRATRRYPVLATLDAQAR
ncbi:MAG: hypothetical protein ACRDQA_20470, partial [Nocardioidaceae bacterium]